MPLTEKTILHENYDEQKWENALKVEDIDKYRQQLFPGMVLPIRNYRQKCDRGDALYLPIESIVGDIITFEGPLRLTSTVREYACWCHTGKSVQCINDPRYRLYDYVRKEKL